MKIDVCLPKSFETKWKRLQRYLKDDQILMLAAVDLLWERYGDEVCSAERANDQNAKRLSECKERLAGLRLRKANASVANDVPVFVGKFRRKVGKDGCIKLPEEWLAGIDCSKDIRACRKKKDGEICLVMERDAKSMTRREVLFAQEKSDMKDCVKIPREWLSVGQGEYVTLIGRLWYVVVERSR